MARGDELVDQTATPGNAGPCRLGTLSVSLSGFGLVIVRIILEGAAPVRNPAWLLRIDGGSLPAFMVARPIGGAHGGPLADWARDRLGLTLKIVSRFRRQRLVGLR
uniref:hypothetical protein n=1 Tax=Nonomuraea bangladeshensis TaxID=404385 RepID=UPI003F4919F2